MAEAKISRISSDFETQLSGAISSGASSFTIQSVTDLDGNSLSDGIYCFTIDRDSTDAKEYLVGQLTASTKTVASISSVSRQGALTSNAQRSHRIGANVIISDHSILSAFSRILNGVDTINPASPLAYTSNPTLSSSAQLATKGYVDSVVTGGTINTDRIILGSQTAGETVASGNIVYFKSADQRWWLADADLTATFSGLQLGVALGSGTAGNSITNGVLIYGKCDSFTSLTAGSKYYLSNTAGGVSSSAGTNSVPLGFAEDTDTIFFNPNVNIDASAPTAFVSTSAGAGDSGKGVKLNASGVFDSSFTKLPVVNVYTSSTTWTKPTGLKYIIVEVIGGGGGGESLPSGHTANRAGAAGGGGGYCKKKISTGSLGSTETVTVGAGGTANAPGGGGSTGNTGATSSFGVHCSATGGTGGVTGTKRGGSGGVGSGGDVNIGGGAGAGGYILSNGTGGPGGSSVLGGGGAGAGGGGSQSGDNGQNYGGGAGGVFDSGTSPITGSNGADGVVIVTEYYN